MGIMSMIAQKKQEFQEKIRERQYMQYQSNQQKLKIARAEHHELELQRKAANQLKAERQKIRELKTEGLRNRLSGIRNTLQSIKKNKPKPKQVKRLMPGARSVFEIGGSSNDRPSPFQLGTMKIKPKSPFI